MLNHAAAEIEGETNPMNTRIIVLILALALVLAACGGQPTPTATSLPPTEAATNTPRPPTATPEPTPDMSTLSAEELWGMVEDLEQEIANQQQSLNSASGAEAGSIQSNIDRLNRQMRDLVALAEAAGPRPGTEAEAGEEEAEATAEASGS
jgi:hypothetical protein